MKTTKREQEQEQGERERKQGEREREQRGRGQRGGVDLLSLTLFQPLYSSVTARTLNNIPKRSSPLNLVTSIVNFVVAFALLSTYVRLGEIQI